MKQLILIMALLISPITYAQVACTNCANWWTQVSAKYELVLQKAVQLEQLRVQIDEAQRAIAEGRVLDKLATKIPGYAEFADAHRLIWETQEVGRGLSKYTKTLEDSRGAFGTLLKKSAYSDVYKRWADDHKKATLRSFKHMGMTSDNLLDLSEKRKQVDANRRGAQSQKQLLQSELEHTNLQLEQMEQLLSIMQAQYKLNVEVERRIQEHRELRQKLSQDARASNVTGTEPTGWAVQPGQEFNN